MAWVLVIDDDDDTRDAMRFALEGDSYQVADAATAQQALSLLRASAHRTVVILDNMMPGLSGEDLLRIVAADPHLAAYHGYILCTASPHRLDAALGTLLAQLAAPVLAKPFHIDELLETVATVAARLITAD